MEVLINCWKILLTVSTVQQGKSLFWRVVDSPLLKISRQKLGI